MPRMLRLMIGIFVLLALGYLVYSSLHTARYRYRVCVRFHGQTACRIAEGRTRTQAEQGALDDACAQIASGVTGTITCQQKPVLSMERLPLQ